MAKYKVKTDKGIFLITTEDGTATEPAQKQPNAIQSALSLDPNASVPTQVAQVATTPFRGMRGAAVGAQNLATNLMTRGALAMIPGASVGNPPLYDVVNRAAEAVKPGFKPVGIAETAASMIGESAPLLPLGGPAMAGFKGAATAAATNTATSALMQKSERGAISPSETAATAGLSALVPAIPAIIKKSYPALAARFTDIPKEGFQKVLKDPDFFKKYTGSVQAIEKRANTVINWFQELEKKVRGKLDEVEEVFQLKPTPAEQVAENTARAGVPRTIDVIEKDLQDILNKSKKFVTQKVKSEIVGPSGKELYRTVKTPGLPPRDRLIKLLQLNDDLNDNLIGGSTKNKNVHGLKTRLREAISDLPGGEEMLDAKKTFHGFRNIAENLTKSLTDEHKSSAVLEKLVRGDIKGALTDKQAALKSVVEDLEEYGMPMVMKPLREEILSNMMRQGTSKYTPKGVIGKAIMLMNPALGATEMALSSPAFMASQYVTSPIRSMPGLSRRVVPSIPSLLRGEQ